MLVVDKMLMLTFLLGAIVIVCTILAYQNTGAPMQVRCLLDILQSGLGFYFVAYSVLAVSTDTNLQMYRYFILFMSLLSWLIWILLGKLSVEATSAVIPGPIENATLGGWDAVADKVARPLALGSMFALPYVFLQTYP